MAFSYWSNSDGRCYMGSRQQAAPSWISFWSAMACHRPYIFTWKMSILSMSLYTGSMLKMGKAHHPQNKKTKIELGLHRPPTRTCHVRLRTWQVRVAGNRPLETGEKKKKVLAYIICCFSSVLSAVLCEYTVCAHLCLPGQTTTNDFFLISSLFLPLLLLLLGGMRLHATHWRWVVAQNVRLFFFPPPKAVQWKWEADEWNESMELFAMHKWRQPIFQQQFVSYCHSSHHPPILVAFLNSSPHFSFLCATTAVQKNWTQLLGWL